ncbi:MAG: YciI family protein [Pseudomonadota bacterium]
MNTRHLYLVMLKRRPVVDPAAIEAHRAFLEALRAQGVLERSGPFTDKSGGAYLIHAHDLAAAQAIVDRDPASTSGGWDVTIHEWQAR